METVVWKLLFIVSVSAQYGKHVYVSDDIEWPSAQEYCRQHHTDLSPLAEWEEMKLKNATIDLDGEKVWIGLYNNGTQWMWSGGQRATYLHWDNGEPDGDSDKIYVNVCLNGCGWNGWHNEDKDKKLPFFCYNLIVIQREATWEQAQRYCKQKHTMLTSLASETENLLAVREIQHDHITERVWIGLRYLSDRWLWVDRHPLGYQAWAQGDQDHQCPIWNRCGALTKGGLWESWDCNEKLSFICH